MFPYNCLPSPAPQHHNLSYFAVSRRIFHNMPCSSLFNLCCHVVGIIINIERKTME